MSRMQAYVEKRELSTGGRVPINHRILDTIQERRFCWSYVYGNSVHKRMSSWWVASSFWTVCIWNHPANLHRLTQSLEY